MCPPSRRRPWNLERVVGVPTRVPRMKADRGPPGPPWWEGPGLALFVDGAHDGPSWRMGGFSEFLGVRSYVARRLRAQSQQLVELQSLAWGIRLAVRLRYTTVTLVSDFEMAIAQLLQFKAKSVLGAQQSVLRGLAPCLFRPRGEGSVGSFWFPTRGSDVPAPG